MDGYPCLSDEDGDDEEEVTASHVLQRLDGLQASCDRLLALLTALASSLSIQRPLRQTSSTAVPLRL